MITDQFSEKYAVLSALQLVAAVSFQIAFLLTCLLSWTEAPLSIVIVYADILNELSMLDCLLLIICIYSGFARQPTVRYVHLIHLFVG